MKKKRNSIANKLLAAKPRTCEEEDYPGARKKSTGRATVAKKNGREKRWPRRIKGSRKVRGGRTVQRGRDKVTHELERKKENKGIGGAKKGGEEKAP